MKKKKIHWFYWLLYQCFFHALPSLRHLLERELQK
jgi:hypothetical protein